MSDEASQTRDAVWARLDSLSSLLSDWERTAGRASPGSIEDNPTLDQSDLDRLYRGNVYAGRIIDLLPDECTRRGIEVTYQQSDEADQDEDPVGDELDRLGALVLLGQADKLARKDGDAALYLGIDDGQAVDQPVDRERVRRVTHLSLVERWSLTPFTWQDDWTKPGFAEPLLWQLSPYNPGGASAGTVMVHRDRLLFLGGRWLPPRLRAYNGHHDDSVLQRCWRVILDFRRSEKDIGTVLRSFNQATIQLPGLQQMLMSGNRDAVLTRLDLLNVGLSLSGMHLLGDGETLDFKARSVAGLAELYDRLAQGLAAAAETPLTMLFGQSPGGLSTDDAGGRTYWYDRVVARQQNVYRPALRRLGELVALASDGPCAGIEPMGWDVQFLPLTEPTEKERQEAREAQSRIDRAYWDMGVLTEQEIRASRFGGTGYSFETTLIEGEEPELAEVESDPLDAPPDQGRPGRNRYFPSGR